MNKMLRDKKAIAIFVLPAFILFTAVLFVPICQSVWYSFCDYGVATKPTWNNFANYKEMWKNTFNNGPMGRALKNSIFFMIFSVVSQLVMGLVLAGLLTNVKHGRNTFKNIYYLPCVLSSAAIGLMWMLIFSPSVGINRILENFGIEGPEWLYGTNGFIALPMWIIALVALWQYVGQSMMLYMAQISGINSSLYEAAYIDGATKPQAFFRITLPLCKPMMGTAMSLNAIGALKFFDLVWTMIGDGDKSIRICPVIATYLYREYSKFGKYGYSSAIGVVLLAMCLLSTFIITKLAKSENYEM